MHLNDNITQTIIPHSISLSWYIDPKNTNGLRDNLQQQQQQQHTLLPYVLQPGNTLLHHQCHGSVLLLEEPPQSINLIKNKQVTSLPIIWYLWCNRQPTCCNTFPKVTQQVLLVLNLSYPHIEMLGKTSSKVSKYSKKCHRNTQLKLQIWNQYAKSINMLWISHAKTYFNHTK